MVFGEATNKISRVEITPQNSSHRITKQRFLAIYYKNGSQYTKIPQSDWRFELNPQTGTVNITLIPPLNTTEVKIHCKFDDREVENFEIAELSQFEFLSDSKIKVYLIPPTRQETFTYDSRGNRTTQSEVIFGSTSHSYTYYPSSDRLLSDGEWAFSYDANGNMVEKGNRYTISGSTVTFDTANPEGEYWEYGYDCFNRLEWAKKNGSVVARYLYDPTGLRIAKLAGDGTVLEMYDYGLDGNLIYHEVPSSNQINSYVWANGQILARVDGVIGSSGAKYFYHDDHLGSPEVITNAAGEIVWKGKYTPFGEKIADPAGLGSLVI